MASTIRACSAGAAPGEAAVGDLVGQRVLERVLELGEQARLVEELGGLEASRDPARSASSGSVGDRLQQRVGHILADDRGRLEQPLVLGGQAVDARREDRLDRRRAPGCVDGRAPGDRRRARRPARRSRPGAHALLEEERLPSRALDQEPLERLEARSRARAGCRAARRRSRRQSGRAEAAVVGLAAPGVLVLGPVVHEQQDAAPSGRLSTRLSRNAWVSASIQCRSSKTRSSGCTWLSRSSRRLSASSVRWRRCGGSSACQAASSSGTSSRARKAGSVGLERPVERQQLAGHLLADRRGRRPGRSIRKYALSRSMTGR